MQAANDISNNNNNNNNMSDTNTRGSENIERLQKKVAESQAYLNDLQEQFAAVKRRKAREHEQQQKHHHNNQNRK